MDTIMIMVAVATLGAITLLACWVGYRADKRNAQLEQELDELRTPKTNSRGHQLVHEKEGLGDSVERIYTSGFNLYRTTIHSDGSIETHRLVDGPMAFRRFSNGTEEEFKRNGDLENRTYPDDVKEHFDDGLMSYRWFPINSITEYTDNDGVAKYRRLFSGMIEVCVGETWQPLFLPDGAKAEILNRYGEVQTRIFSNGTVDIRSFGGWWRTYSNGDTKYFDE